MSIQFKLLFFVIGTLLLATASILFVVNMQFVSVIDENQQALYNERLGTILGILQGYEERLQKTGQVEAYTDGFQELAIKALRRTYYTQEDLRISPFIMNHEHEFVMFPAFSAGEKLSEIKSAIVNNMKAAEILTSGSFVCGKYWYVYAGFAGWNWVIAYMVPLDMKYAEVYKLRRILLSIMLGITTLSVIIMSLAIIRITQPLGILTQGARAIASGNYSSMIAVNGSGEIHELTSAFNHMAEAVNGKILALKREIDERHRIEKTLRELEAKQAAMIANISDVIAIIGKDGIVQYTSPNIEKWFGWQPQDLVGKDGWFRVHPEDRGRIQQEFMTLLKSENSVKTVEHRSQCKDGSYKSIQMTGMNLTNDPIIHGVLVSYHDISARKNAERELDLYRIHLEELVSERTAALQAVNDELRSFAYIASHDLKAPLRAIGRLAHWLAEDYADVIDERGKEMTTLLIGRVKRMDNLIEGILQYSRIGRQEQQHEPIQLNALVAEIVEALAPPEHITVTIENELPLITGDRVRMEQVFQNLIGNAIKFLGDAKGDVRIGCVAEDSQWKFWVVDTGPGIEERHYERIFQIFETLRPRDEQENTGVGLSIVKKIVEFSGGKIWVESRVGEGSSFFFHLPKERRRRKLEIRS